MLEIRFLKKIDCSTESKVTKSLICSIAKKFPVTHKTIQTKPYFCNRKFDYSPILKIIKMVLPSPAPLLSNVQVELLKLYSVNISDDVLLELKKVISKFLMQKMREEKIDFSDRFSVLTRR